MIKKIITFLCISIFSFLSAQESENLSKVNIGIVYDGPWIKTEQTVSLFKREIDELLKGEFEINYAKELDCQWNIELMKQNFDNLLNDPEVDIIITLGEIVSRIAFFYEDLPKPVIAPFAVNSQLHGMPYNNGVTGVNNLNYITFFSDLTKNIQILHQLYQFDFAVYLEYEVSIQEPIISNREDFFPRNIELSNCRLDAVAVGQDIDEVFSKIPDNAEAVIAFPLLNIPYEKTKELFSRIKAKGIPVFTLFDLDEDFINLGAVAGITPVEFFPRIARRLALNLQRILLGENPGQVPVQFPIQEELVINIGLALDMNIYPDWGIMTDAKTINKEKDKTPRLLTLFETIKEALNANLSLKAKDEDVLSSEQDVRNALANLLPQLDISATGTMIDKDRAESGFGQAPERTIDGTLTLTQILFNEEVRAKLNVQEITKLIKENERLQTELDITLDAAVGYLNVMRAKTFERIQKDNLSVSVKNLEVAKFREDIGISGAAEVYRWESEIATNKKEVIDASAQRNLAEIELNRLMNKPLEESFETEADDIDSLIQLIGDRRMFKYFNNKWYFKIFRKFMVKEAFLVSPELKIIDQAIQAQSRVLSSSKKTLYFPKIIFQGQLNNNFYRGGVGSKVDPVTIPGLGSFTIAEEPKDFSWNASVNFSLPLYLGGSRYANIQKNTIELRKLELEKESLKDVIEQRVRSALHNAGASFAGMTQANLAAEAAIKSFELVADSYQRGAVSIVDLIDAQNAALVANQFAADAKYSFMIDMMNSQRALGDFIYSATEEERIDFFKRLNEFFEKSLLEKDF